MDYAACNVVYVDRSAREERLFKSDDPALAHLDVEDGQGMVAPLIGQDGILDANLCALLKTFSEGTSRYPEPSRDYLELIILQYMCATLAKLACQNSLS